jgi:hypothetical protein
MLSQLAQTEKGAVQQQVTMPVGELLYEARFVRTGIADYGVSLEDLMTGRAVPPAAGARIDVYFEGQLYGPKLKGYLKGIDYLLVRADGRSDLNMHAAITTEDGARIAFWSDGIFVPPTDGSGIAQIRENVRLTTADTRYQWVNLLQVWITGTIDIAKEEIRVQAYIA